ncbi:poly [ADP-ribose] polymerase tankyrase-2-like [Schistocerca cancellata]|uniref:poly [ADP-ribose] polymerase tankyrase-2-like n=1 Tax=Schistocerca cancellata TaxID=274614 RepID=UPI0021183EDF|nr:poly [ADP-ribose] polymerase tankyrase-2-like [Schistocerca cancellata]
MGELQVSDRSLSDDLATLLESGRGADVVLLAGGSRLAAHSSVLAARSPVFAAMLRKAGRGACVQVLGVEEEVARQLLRFVYTDKAPRIDDLALDLLVAADKIALPLLKEMCEEQAARHIAIENAASVAALALENYCTALTNAAVAFIKNHHAEVMRTDGWTDLMQKNTHAATEICRLVVASETESSAATRRLRDGRGTLAADLSALLESADFSDVNLVVGGSRLPAHSALLRSRSPVFSSMLEDASDGCLHVHDVEEGTLRRLLNFLYTDRLPPPEALSDSMLTAAHLFGLPVLKKHAELESVKRLGVENAAATAVLAATHGCPLLETVAVDFIRRHITEVMATDGWKAALRNNTETAVRICSLVASAGAPAGTATSGRTVPEERVGANLTERLHEAAGLDDVGELRTLLAAGVAVDARDRWGRTALHCAAEGDGEKAARWLLHAGGDASARSQSQRTPLHGAAARAGAQLARLLLGAGAEVNACDQLLMTPLHWAVANPSVEVARLLLAAGADRHARDCWGHTPLDLAAACDRQALVDVLK